MSETSAAERALRGELERGETILWIGQPSRRHRAGPQDPFGYPASLVIGWLLVSYEPAFVITKTPFHAIGIPAALVGLGLLFGYYVNRFRRARTYYVLTNRRVIVRVHAFPSKTQSLPLDAVARVSISEHGDGTSAITLGAAPSGRQSEGGARSGSLVFDAVAGAPELSTLLRNAQLRLEPTAVHRGD